MRNGACLTNASSLLVSNTPMVQGVGIASIDLSQHPHILHTSRWARNAMISRRYKDELRARGVDVIALNAPFDVARPEGKFAERLMEAVDEFTSDTIGFWVRVGLREEHEQGQPLGLLPETFVAV